MPDDRLIASVHGRAYLNLSALLRMAAALLPAHAAPLLAGAGLAWVAGFGGFALAYSAMLFRPRR